MSEFRRDRFDGDIAGVGTASGRRFVVGRWQRSPFGAFADVMVAHPDGRREFIAPDDVVAEYVSATYRFDDVTIAPVAVERVESFGSVEESPSTRALPAAGSQRPRRWWRVAAGDLRLTIDFGGRLPLALALLGVRGPLVRPATAMLANPVARVVMPGVRTAGSAGRGRREFYVAQDLHAVTRASGTWAGADVGGLTDVTPEPGFGFSSTPRRPSLTTVATFIDVP